MKIIVKLSHDFTREASLHLDSVEKHARRKLEINVARFARNNEAFFTILLQCACNSPLTEVVSRQESLCILCLLPGIVLAAAVVAPAVHLLVNF